MYTYPIIPNRKGDSTARVSCFYQVHRPNIHHGRGLHVVYDYYIMCGACVVRRFVWGGNARTCTYDLIRLALTRA